MKNTLLEKQETKQRQHWLDLSVIFTTVPHTFLSLRTAAQLTRDLETHIQLLAPDYAGSPAFRITPRTLADFAARYFLTLLPHRRDLQIKVISYPAHTTDLGRSYRPVPSL